VHNVSHCSQRRTEPRPQVTCTENVVKFERVFLRYDSGETDRQTYKHADHNTSHPYRRRSNNAYLLINHVPEENDSESVNKEEDMRM